MPVCQVMDTGLNTEVCCALPVVLCILYCSDITCAQQATR